MAALILDPRLDLPEAGKLHAALLARSGTPLVVDAGAVTHLGALCLQVLLAAARDWRKKRLDLTVAPISDHAEAALAAFGLSPADLQSVPGEDTSWC